MRASVSAPSTDAARFAIVCDASCNLAPEALAAAGVRTLSLSAAPQGMRRHAGLDVEALDLLSRLAQAKGDDKGASLVPGEDDLVGVLNELADAGSANVLVLHAARAGHDVAAVVQRAARRVSRVNTCLIELACPPSQVTLVLARLVADRDGGMSPAQATQRAVELSRASRLAIIPLKDPGASTADTVKLALRKKIMGEANRLRLRATGTRRMLVSDESGQMRELSRSTELARLAGNIARTMSTYSRQVGPLTYAGLRAGDSWLLAVIEKHLDTNEFQKECAGVLEAHPDTLAKMGSGAAGVVYAPSRLLSADELRALIQLQDVAGPSLTEPGSVSGKNPDARRPRAASDSGPNQDPDHGLDPDPAS